MPIIVEIPSRRAYEENHRTFEIGKKTAEEKDQRYENLNFVFAQSRVGNRLGRARLCQA
jgi:hypothetical protein